MRVRLLKPFKAILSTEKEIYIKLMKADIFLHRLTDKDYFK